MVILFDEKKEKNMKREAMLVIMWIFYGRQNPLAYWCPRAVKFTHMKN
jgi:hypothetical protein